MLKQEGRKLENTQLYRGLLALMLIVMIVLGSIEFNYAAEPLYHYDIYELEAQLTRVKRSYHSSKIFYTAGRSPGDWTVGYMWYSSKLDEKGDLLYSSTRQTRDFKSIPEGSYIQHAMSTQDSYMHPKSSIYIYEKWRRSASDSDNYGGSSDWDEIDVYDTTLQTNYIKGSFKEKTVGKVDEYPVDGRLGDKWYVRGGIVNTPPTVPSSITVPPTIKGGEAIRVEWGASTDADGNLTGYDIERSVNGGAFTKIAQNNLNTRFHVDTITKGWNTVAYRVRAYDSNSEFSGYVTSPTRNIINNTVPIMTITTPIGTSYFNNGKTITLSGTVTDPDVNTLTISATINGKTKTTTVAGPATNKAWSLSWSSNELAEGSYSGIVVTVNDGNGGTASKTYSGSMVVDKTPAKLQIKINK